MASSVFLGWLGGVPVSSSGTAVTVGGSVLVGDGSAAAPSYSFASAPTSGVYLIGAQPTVSVSGIAKALWGTSYYQLKSDYALEWSSSTINNVSDVSLSRGAAGTLTLNVATATPAGGSTACRLVFGSTAGFGIYIGSGAPSVSAAQGSLYLRSNGTTTNDRMYVNNSSGSGTTWTAVTTAA